MTRLLQKTISYQSLLLLAAALLLVCLIPLLLVSDYMVPAGDDFSFSTSTHAALEEGTGVLTAAAEKTAEVYDSWQGSFAAVFLMTLQPGIFGFSRYGITTFIMLGMLLCSTALLCRRLFTDLLGLESSASLLIAAAIALMCTQFLPLAYQSFFWYNGSVYYTFFYALLLFAASLALSVVRFGGAGRTAVLCALLFVIGGGNYVTALLAAVLFTGAAVFLMILKNPNGRRLLLPLTFLLAAMILSMLAPGNAVRQAGIGDHPGPAEAVEASILYTWTAIRHFVTLPYFAFALVFFPVLWSMASGCTIRARLPLLVSILSFLLLAVMQCPHIYATGGPGPERIQNIIYFAFIFLSVFNVFWWFAYIQQKTGLGKEQPGLAMVLTGTVLAAAVMVFAIGRGQTMTSVLALSELRTGEAQGYWDENMERLRVLEDPSVSDAVFPPLKNTPVLLFSEDLKDDPGHYMNEDVATYFGKNSVVVRQT